MKVYDTIAAMVKSTGLVLHATDAPKALARAIRYDGTGWYSMDDHGTYWQGTAATCSRIRIESSADDDSDDPTSVDYRPSPDTLALARSIGARV